MDQEDIVQAMQRWGMFLLLGVVCAGLAGCDGEGLVWSGMSGVNGGDQAPGDSSDGGGPVTPAQDKRFAGDWAACFSDDVATSSTATGRIAYVLRMTLTQNVSSVNGTGRVVRVFGQGSTAYDTDPRTFNVTGTASGADLVLTFSSGSTVPFDFSPTWYLRMLGSQAYGTQMVGLSVAMDTSGEVARSGIARWYSIGSSTLDGDWVTAFTDSIPLGSANQKDHTGEMTVSRSGQSIAGAGNLYTQRDNDVLLTQSFSISRSLVTGQELGFSFGGSDLTNLPYDWFAVFDGTHLLSAYAAFGSNQPDATLINAGTATWYRPLVSTPAVLTHAWTAAFQDTSVADPANRRRGAYVAVMNLTGGSGGTVTGTASILNESDTTPAYRTYDVANGSIVGSQARLELRDRSSNAYFSWDFQVISNGLLGSYQYFGNDGAYVSRGTAQWWYQSPASPKGTWAAVYYDTQGETKPAVDQLALVTINTPASDGSLTGFGALRYAGETRRRLFNLTGNVSGSEVTWKWAGTGLYGDTDWHLRQGSNLFVSTYTNRDTSGGVEYRGYAIWFKTLSASGFTQ